MPPFVTALLTVLAVGMLGGLCYFCVSLYRDLDLRPQSVPRIEAMCYSVSIPEVRVSHTCPECGEKTIYPSSELTTANENMILLSRWDCLHLPSYDGFAIGLDESEFCSHCMPNAKDPQLSLIVPHADGTQHVIRPVTSDDLAILRAFLQGDGEYVTSNDGRLPLSAQFPRIKQLLGVDILPSIVPAVSAATPAPQAKQVTRP